MARHEPQVTSKVVDMSIATIVNLESEFVVVTFVASKTGPLGMQICNGTADFIDKFMTTDKVIASDHTSVLHTYKLLENTPAVVFRVDTCEILSGLDDTGKLLWFDKSKDLIPVLSKIDVQANDQIQVMYIVVDDVVYYVGDSAKIPADVTMGKTVTEVADTPVDIQQLAANLDLKTVDKGYPVFIGYKDYLSTFDLGDVKSYISPSTIKNTLKSSFNRIRVLGTEKTCLESDYITIGNNDYILRTEGGSDLTNENNPIYVELDPRLVNINQYLFLTAALNSALINGAKSFINGCTWRPVVTFSTGDTTAFTVKGNSESLFKSLLIQGGEGTISFKVTCNDFSVQNNQYLVISMGSDYILFYNGTVDKEAIKTELSIASFAKEFSLGFDAMSIYGFLVGVYKSLALDSEFVQASYTTTFAFADSTSDLMFYKENDTSIGVHFVSEAKSQVSVYEDTNSDVVYQYIFPTQETVQNELTHDCIYIKMNDYVFYTGNYVQQTATEIPIRLGPKSSVMRFQELLYQNVSLYFEAAIMKGGEILVSSDISVSVGPEESGVTPIVFNKDIINQAPQSKFAIVQNFSSYEALFSFDYAKQLDYNDKVYTLNLKYKDWSGEYEITFDPTVVSQAGLGIYYPVTNNAQEYFTIVELNKDADTEDVFASRRFGNDCHGSDPTENDFVATAQQMTELDDFYPNILFDGGLMNPTFYKALANLAYQPGVVGSLNAQVYIGIPKEGKDYAKIAQIRNQIGLDSFHCYYIQPCFWDTCGDFSAVFGGHLYYIIKVVQNFRSIVNEFQPPFGPENGGINPGYLMTTELGKTDRTKLLQISVNSIVRKASDGTYYVNQNYTAQKFESDLSEEQIARLVLLINQVVDRYMHSTIGSYNTPDLRDKVTKNLNSMINERFILNHNGGLLQFRVICNDSNNTPAVIQSRKIRVRILGLYQRSIDWAEITNEVYDLAQEEEFNSAA